jgi:glycosyltransferase involved in cell wall biosynthesis
MLAIFYKDFKAAKPGVSHVGLGVTGKLTAAVLIKCGIDAQAVPVIRFDDILLYLSNNPKVTRVVIAAPWVSVSDMEILLKQFPTIKFVVTSHSNFGFLAVEPAAIKLLRDYGALTFKYNNFQLGSNSEKFIQAWRRMYDVSMVYLPNLYELGPRKSNRPLPSYDPIKIGCFGAVRPLKNFVSAVAACIDISVRMNQAVEIYMNTGRDEGGSVTIRAIDELVVGLPKVKLIKSAWSEHNTFKELIGRMDLNMQVSYTESFNMVTADSISQNIPVVVSDAIYWAPKSWIAKVDEVGDISRVGIELLKNKSEEAEKGRIHLTNFIRNGIDEWINWLKV